MSHDAVIIRATTYPDTDALSNLVTLGSRSYVPGRGLVAEVDGTAVAAISLTSGAVVVDLDRAHPRTVGSLKYRRYQVLRQAGDTGSARMLLRRPAPVPARRHAA